MSYINPITSSAGGSSSYGASTSQFSRLLNQAQQMRCSYPYGGGHHKPNEGHHPCGVGHHKGKPCEGEHHKPHHADCEPHKPPKGGSCEGDHHKPHHADCEPHKPPKGGTCDGGHHKPHHTDCEPHKPPKSGTCDGGWNYTPCPPPRSSQSGSSCGVQLDIQRCDVQIQINYCQINIESLNCNIGSSGSGSGISNMQGGQGQGGADSIDFWKLCQIISAGFCQLMLKELQTGNNTTFNKPSKSPLMPKIGDVQGMDYWELQDLLLQLGQQAGGSRA